jgi:hypothetical protein
MEHIKIINRKKKGSKLYFCDYNPILDEAINNFKEAKTVKVIKNIVFIEQISLGYFTEILSKNKISFSVITTLN